MTPVEPVDSSDPVDAAARAANKQEIGGCGVIAAIAAIILVALGWATVSKTGTVVLVGSDSESAAPTAQAAPNVGALPDVGVNGPASSSRSGQQSGPVAQARSDAGSSASGSSGSADAGQQVAQAPSDAGSSGSSGSDGGGSTPPPPPPATCALPGSITVQGGNPGSVGGSGGTVTVASTPFALITPTLVNCGQHYELLFSASGNGGTASGHDCKMEGFDYDISAYVQVGQTVTIQLLLPPNECG
jgi:hypothetical protein